MNALQNLDKTAIAKMDTQTLARAVDNAVRRMKPGELDEYVAEQRAMFAARGQNENRAYKFAIVATGETLPNGVEVCKIIKRGVDLTPSEDDNTHIASVCGAKSYADRVGFDRPKPTAKYGDENRLIANEVSTIEVGEVAAWATM